MNETRPNGSTVSKTVAATTAAVGFLAAKALLEIFRAHSAERCSPPLGHLLKIDGARLHYLDCGRDRANSSSPAVLLHGNGAMIEDFLISGVIDCVSRSRRVISFDRPGFGHSDRPPDRSWTAEAQANLIYEACANLGVERPVLVGHSWGTLVALAMALAHPGEACSSWPVLDGGGTC